MALRLPSATAWMVVCPWTTLTPFRVTAAAAAAAVVVVVIVDARSSLLFRLRRELLH